MTIPDTSRAGWRKGSRSGQNGNCVEVAAAHDMVAIRDSKAPDTPHLIMTAQGWRSLLSAVKRGTFDH